MKKILILTIAALAFACTEASAQSWLDALKSAASTAIDKVTGGKLTEKAIVWTKRNKTASGPREVPSSGIKSMNIPQLPANLSTRRAR